MQVPWVCNATGKALYHRLLQAFHGCSVAKPGMLTGSVLACSLHSVHEEEKPFELEICWISDATSRVFQRVPEDVLQAAEQAAKASLEESDMCALPLHAQLLHDPRQIMYSSSVIEGLTAIQQTTGG